MQHVIRKYCKIQILPGYVNYFTVVLISDLSLPADSCWLTSSILCQRYSLQFWQEVVDMSSTANSMTSFQIRLVGVQKHSAYSILKQLHSACF